MTRDESDERGDEKVLGRTETRCRRDYRQRGRSPGLPCSLTRSAGMKGSAAKLLRIFAMSSTNHETRLPATHLPFCPSVLNSQCSRPSYHSQILPFQSRSPEALQRLLGCTAGSADAFGIALTIPEGGP